MLIFNGVICFSKLKKDTTSESSSTGITSSPSTIAASVAFSLGRISPLKPSLFALKAIGRTPFMLFNRPSKDNSPSII